MEARGEQAELGFINEPRLCNGASPGSLAPLSQSPGVSDDQVS